MDRRMRSVFAGTFRVLTVVLLQALPAGAGEPLASRYLPEIEAVGHPSVAAPAEPLLPRWDFAAGRDWRYRFRQQAQTRVEVASAPPERENVTLQSVQGSGTFLLKGGGGVAEARLKDYLVRKQVEPGKGKPAKTVEQTYAFQVLSRVGEDGAPRIWRDRDVALGALLALPPRPLALGESADVPVRIPFEAGGSVLEVEGLIRITLADFVEIGGRLCARLDAEIDLSRTEAPPDVEGRFHYAARGASVLFFDPEGRRLVSGRVALRTGSVAEMPVPLTAVDGKVRKNWPEWSRVGTETDTFLLLEEDI